MDSHTAIGTGISCACIALAESAESVAANLLHITMPPIVMQSAQVFAWLAGGIAACVTIFSWYEKRKKRKTDENS